MCGVAVLLPVYQIGVVGVLEMDVVGCPATVNLERDGQGGTPLGTVVLVVRYRNVTDCKRRVG